MVTDNKVDRIDTILEYSNLKKYFDVVSISAKLQSGKDKRYIFEDTILNLKIQPEECVFIDNTDRNLIIPKSMGIDTWGVDFVLLNENDEVLGKKVSYRDRRTEGIIEEL